jgi:hypothetical protein
MNLAQQLCLWADELRAVASNGLQFNSNPYDRANYEQIGRIAAEMFARAVDRPVEELVPILAKTLGQATPLAVGDAIVINDGGEILLIQRADSGLWATPGGAFEVGETAAEGACRECYEETGGTTSGYPSASASGGGRWSGPTLTRYPLASPGKSPATSR